MLLQRRWELQVFFSWQLQNHSAPTARPNPQLGLGNPRKCYYDSHGYDVLVDADKKKRGGSDDHLAWKYCGHSASFVLWCMACDKQCAETHIAGAKHDNHPYYPQMFTTLRNKYDAEYIGYINSGGEHYE
jgi:hypothetical protein